MELIKRPIHYTQEGKSIFDQFYLDEDYNVPEQKDDVRRIIQGSAECRTEDIRPVENYVKVTGKVYFRILYMTASGDPKPAVLEGSLPFEEMVYAESDGNETFFIRGMRTEFTGTVVNSRKLSLRVMAEMEIGRERLRDEELTEDVDSEIPIYRKKEKMNLLKLAVSRKDTYRIKEEIVLPGTKESIGQVLLTDIGSRKLDEITFDEMLELASLGAQVLNNRSVELAKKYNVELEVLSSLNPIPGTVVKEVTKDMEGMLIKGVAKDTDVAVITILNVPDEPGMSFKIFGLLAQKNINVDIILQSTGRDGKKDISFTCAEGEADLAMRVLKESAHFHDVSVDTTCAKVSIVGAGMQSHSGVASKMFEALSNNNINIKMISTSEIKISCIINRDDADKAVSAIHDMLFD